MSKIIDRELFIADLHFPDCDLDVLRLVLDYVKRKKITILVLGGDIIDLKSVSYFEKSVNDLDLKEEITNVEDILFTLRNRFKKAKIYYIKGNHERRLEKYIHNKAIELSNLTSLEIPNLFNFKQYNIKYIDNFDTDKSMLNIHGLYHLHGDEIKVGIHVINPSKIFHEKTNSNVIFAHCHRTSNWLSKKLDGNIDITCSVGCLCNLKSNYSPVNMWNHGFAIIDYYSDGKFTIYNKIILDNKTIV